MSTESKYSKKTSLSYLLQIYVNFHILSKFRIFAQFEEKVDFCLKKEFLVLESALNLDNRAEICSDPSLASVCCLWPQALCSGSCLPPSRHQQNTDQTIVTFRQSLTDTCDLLYKVLESVKGLIGFSSFTLLHLPFGNISHFPKEPALWTTRSLGSLDIKTTGKSGFPILNKQKLHSQEVFDFSSSSMSSSARANKIKSSGKFQKWFCMPASRACLSLG